MTDDVAAPPLYAAVDCGSNSTRLLIAGVDGHRVHAVSRDTRITRLGAGVDATGQLDAAAIDRVITTLAGYAQRWRDAGVRDVAITATSAVRDAANAEQFAGAVRAVAGSTPVVLSGRREAELTFAGATAGRAGRHVVCDIGGGSTELVVGDGHADRWVSLQLGSVRLRERHLRNDPPSAQEYAALIADIDALLTAQPDDFCAHGADRLVAVAGTPLTVAAVARGSADPDVDVVDGAVLSVAELAQVIEDLAWLPAAERRVHPPIVPGREDVIVAGALLLHRVTLRFGFDTVEVRVADLLDGIVSRVAADAWPPAEPIGSACA
ncbi:Ppx/GppA phosphatase family protein [soil metagenome]